jgi:hypothetical protein
VPNWRWRVAPAALQDTFKDIRTVATTVAPRAPPVPRQTKLAAMRLGLAIPTTQSSTPPARLGATSSPTPVLELANRMETRAHAAKPTTVTVVQSKVLLRQLQTVRTQSRPQSVTSSSMELHFRYCMVTARRPWLSSAFLTARNWFVPRMRAGDIASGTGLGKGLFEVMPTAALCVRDLRISAAWSAKDRAVLPATTKFGPFSLIGSKLDADRASLLCPATQIIGWVVEPMPNLPPNSDPSLPRA